MVWFETHRLHKVVTTKTKSPGFIWILSCTDGSCDLWLAATTKFKPKWQVNKVHCSCCLYKIQLLEHVSLQNTRTVSVTALISTGMNWSWLFFLFFFSFSLHCQLISNLYETHYVAREASTTIFSCIFSVSSFWAAAVCITAVQISKVLCFYVFNLKCNPAVLNKITWVWLNCCHYLFSFVLQYKKYCLQFSREKSLTGPTYFKYWAFLAKSKTFITVVSVYFKYVFTIVLNSLNTRSIQLLIIIVTIKCHTARSY